jgi:hypothetical protein
MPQKNTRSTARKTRNTRKTRRRTKTAERAAAAAAATEEATPSEEHHHFYSKMVFDGKNITTESQQDDEPVQRRVYTMKQLEREIPIGAELLRNENIHTVPRALQFPIPREVGFRTVLPNPADLGLIPLSDTRRRLRRKGSRSRRGHSSGRNMELIVRDADGDTGRNIFQLPV